MNLPRQLICKRIAFLHSFATRSLPSGFIEAVNSEIPHICISDNKYDLDSHGKGKGYHASAPPAAIFTTSSTVDISKVLRLCNEHRVHVIAFGTGTSVEGHVAALNPNSISLDMNKFKEIGLPHDGILDDAFIEVGAGVTRLELNDALR